MIGSLIINRRRGFSIFGSKATADEYDNGNSSEDYPSKIPTVCGIAIETPDSSRWAHHFHSRILQKFPFLVEMFYWVVNYLFYSITKATSQWLSPADIGVVQVAQDHGVGILNLEHHSILRFLFPIEESDFQSFFLNGHQSMMTFFNRIYSLVHIPGTVL
jgi:hypothetical protein